MGVTAYRAESHKQSGDRVTHPQTHESGSTGF